VRMGTGIRLRRARKEEAQALTDLALRSKRSWGYDESFMQAIMDVMVVRPEYLENEHAIVAEDGNALAAYAIASVENGEAYLRDLFVDPPYMRKGVGGRLFDEVLAFALAKGAKRLSLTADPNAVEFYERRGLRVVAEESSSFVRGRNLPIMAIDLR
jgi:GNAT superfamily N-acetyltransferase